MKPHPRIRKTVKWGGAAVTVLLVVVWVGSGWWACEWAQTPLPKQAPLFVTVGRGFVYMGRWDAGIADGIWIGPVQRPRMSPQFVFRRQVNGRKWMAQAPVWPFVVPPACASMFAWRLDTLARRRAKLNLCPNCNYDRTGLRGGVGGAGAVCPECGAAPASSSSTT